jgi:hypothetical protein
MTCRPVLVWTGILAAAVAAQIHGLISRHKNCTLSGLTRQVCRTESPLGRALFLAGLGCLTAWFARHITTTDKGLLL